MQVTDKQKIASSSSYEATYKTFIAQRYPQFRSLGVSGCLHEHTQSGSFCHICNVLAFVVYEISRNHFRSYNAYDQLQKCGKAVTNYRMLDKMGEHFNEGVDFKRDKFTPEIASVNIHAICTKLDEVYLVREQDVPRPVSEYEC
jgi:hypothetical protein